MLLLVVVLVVILLVVLVLLIVVALVILIILAIVLILLFGIWNLFFGNPVTAMIAGNDMRDWISAEADHGTVYEIRGEHLPRYDSWGMAYCFDLAIPAEHSRAELRWEDGEIRLTDGGW